MKLFKFYLTLAGLALLFTFKGHAQNQSNVRAGGGVANIYSASTVYALSNLLTTVPNNSIIVIQPGTYAMTPVYHTSPSDYTAALFTEPMYLSTRTNIVISGYGATITGTGLGTYLAIRDCENVTVLGLKFDLTKTLGSTLVNSYCGPIEGFGTNKFLYFQKNEIRNATDQGITFNRRVYGAWFDENRFYNIGVTNAQYVVATGVATYVDGTAISGLGSDSYVRHNYFDTCYRAVEWDESASDTITHKNFIVEGNIITNNLHTGIFAYSGQTNAQHLRGVIIRGNSIHHTSTAASVDNSITPLQFARGISIDVGDSVLIEDNFIDNVPDFGISVTCASQIDNLLILGNTINGRETGTTSRGIYVVATTSAGRWDMLRNCRISNNHISHTAHNGMDVSGAYVTINDNSFWNCGMESGVNHYAILLNNNASTITSNVWVSGNIVNNNKGSAQPFIVGVGNSGTAKSIVISRSNRGSNLSNAGVGTGNHSINSAQYANVDLDYMTGVTAAMTSGAVSNALPLIKATSRVIVSRRTTGGTVGHVSVNVTAGAGFNIISSSGTETSTFDYTIVDPNSQ